MWSRRLDYGESSGNQTKPVVESLGPETTQQLVSVKIASASLMPK